MGNCVSSGSSNGHSKSNNRSQRYQPSRNEPQASKAFTSSSSPRNSQFNGNVGNRKNTQVVTPIHKGTSEEPPKIVGERLKPNVGRNINGPKHSTSSQQSLSTQAQKNNDSANSIKYKTGNHTSAEDHRHSVDEHESNKTQRNQQKTQQNLPAQLPSTQPPKGESQLPSEKQTNKGSPNPLQAKAQNSKQPQYVSTKSDNGTYPPPDEDTMNFIEKEFQKGFDFSLKKHKETMNKLVETKEPFTEAQLTQYHNKNLQVTIKAYEEAYRPALVQEHEQVKSLFETKIKELGSSIKKQLMVYQRKHEITIEKVTKMVRDSSNDAEEHYDNLMSGFGFNSKTKNEFLQCHEKYRKDTFSFFDDLLAKKGLKAAEFWRHELNHKLEESCKEHALKFSSQNEICLKNSETSRPKDTISAESSSVQRLSSFTELYANSTPTSAATKFFSEHQTAGVHLKHGSSSFDESVTVTSMSRSTTTTSSISTNESLTSQALTSSFKRRRFSKGTALDISGEEVTENGNTDSYKQTGSPDPTYMSSIDSSRPPGYVSGKVDEYIN